VWLKDLELSDITVRLAALLGASRRVLFMGVLWDDACMGNGGNQQIRGPDR
jgi:hypothetical protein